MRKTLALFAAAFALLFFALHAENARRSAREPPSAVALAHLRAPPYEASVALKQATDAQAQHLGLEIQVHRDAQPASSSPRAIAVVLDRSGSMHGAPLDKARQAVLALARALRPDDALALVSYGSETRVDVPLIRVRDLQHQLRWALDALVGSGGTNLSAGLEAGRRVLSAAPDSALRRLIVLSDGYPNQGITDPDLLTQSAAAAERDGIVLSAIGLGSDYDRFLLKRLARRGGGNYRAVQQPEDIAPAFLDELRDGAHRHPGRAELWVKPGSGFGAREHRFSLADLRGGQSRTLQVRLPAASHRELKERQEVATLGLRFNTARGPVERRVRLMWGGQDAPPVQVPRKIGEFLETQIRAGVTSEVPRQAQVSVKIEKHEARMASFR